MIISQAFAATTKVATKPTASLYSILMNILPFILIFAVFYLILILPQRRKQKAQREMINNIKHGDKIILSSGIIGVVIRVKDQKVIVKTADSTEIEVIKSAIANVVKD